jgi:hypothetical protein
MGMGILLLTGLLLADPGPGEVVAVNDHGFVIPVSFKPELRPQIKEVILFESADQGKQWNQRAVNPPSKDSFVVNVPADGWYLYTIAIVGLDGNREPSDPSKSTRIMRVLVDTKRPDVKLTATRQGDGVVADWTIDEQNPKFSTLKLEYHSADMPAGQWTPVKIEPRLSGRVGFQAPGAALTVRMEIKDEADNSGSQQVEIPAAAAPSGTSLIAQPVSAAPHDGGSALPIPAQPAGMTHTQARPQPDPLDPPPITTTALPPPDRTSQGSSSGALATTGPQSLLLAPPPSAPSATAQPAPRGPLPGLAYVNTNRVTIDYEVDKVGASGLGSVELYVTRDDGGNWQRLTGEQITASPAVEMVNAGPVKRSITAELPGEGRYGFYLIVRSGVGLGKQPPRPGDRPQMRVEVDMTPPEGTLYGLQPVPGQRDAVIVSWAAKDANLAEKPIRLEWAERKGGPWQLIGDGELPNTGRYIWKLPANIPATGKVYLRMTITDLAKNSGVAESPEPVTIDLNEPEAKIIGLGIAR